MRNATLNTDFRTRKKPVISWYNNSDPTMDYSWVPKLTDINIIKTKRITDQFIDVCLQNKHRIYLHVNITGLSQTPFEPNFPTVKETFMSLKKLIDSGFPKKQILLEVNPIIPNHNGLKALKLILRIVTEFKFLNLTQIKFQVLMYANPSHTVNVKPNETKIFSNDNLNKRGELKKYLNILKKDSSFHFEYFNLLKQYETIIHVDKGDIPIIGLRELLPFGYTNDWTENNGMKTKLIFYKNNSKFKPIVNIISPKKIRCRNKCLLCPFLY